MPLSQMQATSVLEDYKNPGLQASAASNTYNLAKLQALRIKQQKNPEQAKAALAYAKEAMRVYKETGHSRFYGYAKGALQAWWDMDQAPKEIWLTRARLMQSNHEFKLAANDLQSYLKQYPKDIEALLLLSDAWKRIGRVDDARRLCLSIALAGRTTLAQICALEVRLSNGYYQGAFTTANLLLDKIKQLDPSEQQWAYAVLAETAVAAKQFDSAVSFYQASIASGAGDLVTYLHYADVYLELGKNEMVFKILSEESNTVPVLLRLSIAESRSETGLSKYREKLDAAINNTLINSNDFLFEKSLYELYVTKNSALSLDYAMQNWAEQKAWEDTELLLSAARATGNDEYLSALEKVKAWRKQDKRQDIY